MKCPKCKDKELLPIYTKQGVEIDYCPSCLGAWLDKGEIFYFTKKAGIIRGELAEAVKYGIPVDKFCPRTGSQLRGISLLKGELKLDYSQKSGGLWLDEGELKKIQTILKNEFKMKIEQPKPAAEEKGSTPMVSSLFPLPNLVLRSIATITFLYGMIILLLITATLFTDMTPAMALIIGTGFAAIQFILGPFIMDLSLKSFYNMEWVQIIRLPVYLRSFIAKTCKKHDMNNPRFGIIHDGAPNAFTYGHTPNNARIVITSGLLHLLNEDEVNAVVAHEIGHAKHWDMLIMTAAQLAPLIFYFIFRIMMPGRSDRNKNKGAAALIAIVSYFLYIVSEYIVLWFSRTREYFADRFAGRETNNPNSLASALVKIGYGLAGKESKRQKQAKDKSQERTEGINAIGALGIFDPKSALAMVAGSVKSAQLIKSMGDEIDKENLKNPMKWDLWNPWALYFELHSTHPLVAKRIQHLSRHSEYVRKEPYIKFDLKKPESFWDEFFVDLFIKFLPFLVFLALLIYPIISYMYTQHVNLNVIGSGLIAIGIASIIKTNFKYKSEFFPDMSIASLLKKVKVSGIRPVPCKVSGNIIGRGIPGLIWSEDFVMQDDTGIMFLDYRQPIPFWDFFFGLLRRARYNNQSVEVTGWFRRAPVPYIEIKSIKDQGEKERKCYTWIAKYIVAFSPVAAGIAIFFYL